MVFTSSVLSNLSIALVTTFILYNPFSVPAHILPYLSSAKEFTYSSFNSGYIKLNLSVFLSYKFIPSAVPT